MHPWQTDRCRIALERNIPFAQPEGVQLTADVWRPADDITRPAVLLIIGGGWRNTHRCDFDTLAAILAGWGYVVVNTLYRKAPDHVWPAQLHDVKTSLRWMRANADEFSLDPDRIACLGSSAGGHLATMLALTANHPPHEGEGHNNHPTHVSAAVCLCAPTDLRDLTRYIGEKEVPHQLIGGTPEEMPDQFADASPITWVSANAAPTLFIHGDQDTVVPIEPTRQTHEQLRQLNAETQFITLPGVGHGVRNYLIVGPDPAPMQAVHDFLARHLQPPGS